MKRSCILASTSVIPMVYQALAFGANNSIFVRQWLIRIKVVSKRAHAMTFLSGASDGMTSLSGGPDIHPKCESVQLKFRCARPKLQQFVINNHSLRRRINTSHTLSQHTGTQSAHHTLNDGCILLMRMATFCAPVRV